MKKGIFYLLILILIIILVYLCCGIINLFNVSNKYIGGGNENNITYMIKNINDASAIDTDKNLKKIEESLIEFKNILMEYNDIVKNNIIINKFIENKFPSSYIYKLATTDDDNLISIYIDYIDDNTIIHGGETPIQKLHNAINETYKALNNKPEQDKFKKGEFIIYNKKNKAIDIKFDDTSLKTIINDNIFNRMVKIINSTNTDTIENKTINQFIKDKYDKEEATARKKIEDAKKKAAAEKKAEDEKQAEAKKKEDDLKAEKDKKEADLKAENEKKEAEKKINRIDYLWNSSTSALNKLIKTAITDKLENIEIVKKIIDSKYAKELIQLYDDIEKLNKKFMLDGVLKHIRYVGQFKDFFESLLKDPKDIDPKNIENINTFFKTLFLTNNLKEWQIPKGQIPKGQIPKGQDFKGQPPAINKLKAVEAVIHELKKLGIELNKDEIDKIAENFNGSFIDAVRSAKIDNLQQIKIVEAFDIENHKFADKDIMKNLTKIDHKEQNILRRKKYMEELLKKNIYMEEYLTNKLSINFKSSTELNNFLDSLKPLTWDEFKKNIHDKIMSLIHGQWIKKMNIKKIDTSINKEEYEKLWKKEILKKLDSFMEILYPNIINDIFKNNMMYRYNNYLKKIKFLKKKDNKWWFNYKYVYEEPYAYSKKNKIYIQTLKDKLNEGFGVYIRESNKFKKQSINFSKTDATRKFEMSISLPVTELMITEGIKNNRLIMGDYSIFNENDKELVHLDTEDINIYRF